MMRATLNIPDDLIEEVLKVSGEKSKTRAIVAAMKSYIKRTRLTELKALQGQVAIDYDWEKEEEMEVKAEEERSRSLEK
jgi:hypothetical protein